MGQRTDTRQRMVTSAALLMRQRGVAGTTVAGVLDHSKSPRGSVGFHFPAGRAELLTEALRWVGGLVSARLRSGVERGAAPADLLREVCEHYKRELEATGFTAGCPVGAAAQEAYADEQLGPVVAGIVDDWIALLAASLEAAGHDGAAARDTALMAVSAIEGAVMMSRVQRSTRPIDLVLALLLPQVAA